jgi:hypothetical protein
MITSMRPVKTWADAVDTKPSARANPAQSVMSLPILQFMSAAPPLKSCVDWDTYRIENGTKATVDDKNLNNPPPHMITKSAKSMPFDRANRGRVERPIQIPVLTAGTRPVMHSSPLV